MTTITVTQKHIDDGIRKSCGRCPVALAIHDVVDPQCWVGVDPFRVYLVDAVSCKLPRGVRDFIGRFDAGKPVSPFSFKLPIPERLLRKTI